MTDFLTTERSWDDPAIDREVRAELDRILAWRNEHPDAGYPALFDGPSGSGKTLAAALLGLAADLPVRRVDLSALISKYIGETEKKLDGVFDLAASKGWILFFDEAEALFGRRTESRSANDRAANQQLAYLLQRIEDYAGIVILATDLRSRLDEADRRRFRSMIRFPAA